jgi:hypothetical protein
VDDDLDGALRVPGFDTSWDGHRVVFTSTESPERVVIWPITREGLLKHVARLRPHARQAWGTPNARSEWLLSVHLEEALAVFDGDRGVMRLDHDGLRIGPTP